MKGQLHTRVAKKNALNDETGNTEGQIKRYLIALGKLEDQLQKEFTPTQRNGVDGDTIAILERGKQQIQKAEQEADLEENRKQELAKKIAKSEETRQKTLKDRQRNASWGYTILGS